jgi:hypothetical protein
VIEPEYLDALMTEVDGIRELDNLTFRIEQQDPKRYILIDIGPGDWTEYTVESDSDTWTLGRHYELTEKLLEDRSFYAKYKRPRPYILVKEKGRFVWETVPWKPGRGWRMTVAGTSEALVWSINRLVPLGALFAIAAYIGDTKKQRHVFIENLNNFSRSGWLAFSLAMLIAYLFLRIAFWRWGLLRLKSRVKISSPSILAQFTFSGTDADVVTLASLYVAIAIFLITLATLFH